MSAASYKCDRKAQISLWFVFTPICSLPGDLSVMKQRFFVGLIFIRIDTGSFNDSIDSMI